MITNYTYLHACQSSLLKRKAIIMKYSYDLSYIAMTHKSIQVTLYIQCLHQTYGKTPLLLSLAQDL